MTDLEPSRICAHLKPVLDQLLGSGARITSCGKPWSKRCHLWVGFDVVLDVASLRSRLALAECVTVHENDDPRSGTELGLFCEEHDDAVIGDHPSFSVGKRVVG